MLCCCCGVWSTGFLVVCLVSGCGVFAEGVDVLAVPGKCVACEGNAFGGGGGVLPGRGVPLFTLNHVSPVQVCSCRTLFCCDLLRS